MGTAVIQTTLRVALFFAGAVVLSEFAPTINLMPTPTFQARGVEDIIVQESLAAGIDPFLPLAIGWRESRYNHRLISATDDWGVMQLNRRTWLALGVKHPLDARENIRAGVRLFSAWVRACDSKASAMSAYARPADMLSAGKCKGL